VYYPSEIGEGVEGNKPKGQQSLRGKGRIGASGLSEKSSHKALEKRRHGLRNSLKDG